MESQRKKLVDYIQKNLKKGYTEDSLRWALIGQGYSRTAVDDAVRQVHLELAKQAPVLKDKPVIKHEFIGDDNKPIIVVDPRKRPWWKRIFE